MGLESAITALVEATKNLTSEVAGKMAGINQAVDTAVKSVPAAAKASMSLVMYVDAVAGSDTNDGKTFGTSFKTVKAAIDSIPQGASAYLNLVGSGDPLAPVVYLVSDAIEVDGKHVVLAPHAPGQLLRLRDALWIRNGGRVRIGSAGRIDVEQDAMVGCLLQGGHLQIGGFYGSKYKFLRAGSVIARVSYQGSDYKADAPSGSLNLQGTDFSETAVSAKLAECYIHGMLTLNTRGVNLGANVTLPTEQYLQVGTTNARIYAL